MAFVIVATGNHFLFDAFAGALVVGVGYAVARASEVRAAAPQNTGYPHSAVARAVRA
jgi:hypothetical protein